MERLAVGLVLLGSVAVASGWARLPVAAIGCAVLLFAYRERFGPVLAKFLVLWMAFSAAVGAGRYWAGTSLRTLALGVASALLLVVKGRPSDLLAALDRLRAPRELSYALLSLICLLPRIASVGSRQLALLELKGLGGGGLVHRLRAYPRIVAPLFGVLLNQQLAHARSMGLRGFFEARSAPSRGITESQPVAPGAFSGSTRSMKGRVAVIGARGWAVIGLLILDAALWIAGAAWTR